MPTLPLASIDLNIGDKLPISEKTVELNVSRTVIEKMRRYHQIQAYALGATQAQESMFGFDVEVTDGTWSGGFIQYKKLYTMAGGLKRWNLNRTAHRDQHSLLLWLEAAGVPVFYCLPDFDDESQLRCWTPPPLWRKVWWIKPSVIPVPAPVDTHHHVTLSTSGVWKVHSGPGTIFDPGEASFNSVEKDWLDNPSNDLSLKSIKDMVNREVTRRWETVQASQNTPSGRSHREASAARARYMGNLLQGLGLISYSRK